ncbi:MAG TPA: hypothetical protein VIJ85_03835 [Rhizomicrobium sp.]
MARQNSRHGQLGISRLAIAGGAILALTASFSVAARADDTCQKVATAKYMQWQQPRIARQMTSHYADGTEKVQSAIFTENTLYVLDGPAWTVGALTIQQHRVRSPEQVASNMGLTDCEMGETVDIAGQHATAYTYKSESLDVGTSGKIWIANDSGLPLRDEMSPDQATAKWPVKMSADYTYGRDVTLPKGAELADFFRRNDGKGVLSQFQTDSSRSFK